MTWCLLIILGLLALLSSGELFEWFINPGETDEHHAFIEDCGQCHDPVASSFSDLAVMGIAGFMGEHSQSGEKCLVCHIAKARPFKPHGAEHNHQNATTVRLTDQQDPTGVDNNTISCATCHQIHQADEAGAIKVLSDGQCQSCHTAPFEGFTDGHPAFRHLPAWSAQILFDHKQHYYDYFAKQHVRDDVPENCTVCHLVDTGAQLQFATFDSMCSDCHLRPDIIDKQLDAIGPTSLIAIPRLDAQQLTVGYWPNCKTSRFKRISDLPLAMRALLETDDVAVAAIALLEAQKTSLNAMKKATDEEREAATQLAWSIKRLVNDIAADDAIERFSPDSNTRIVNDSQLAELVSLVPIDIRRRMTETWFPGLSEELEKVAEINTGSCPDRDDWSAMRSLIEKKKRNIGNNAGWYLQAKSSYMALSYVAQSHADPVMVTLGETLSRFSAGKQRGEEFQCAKCHGLESQDGTYELQWGLQVPEKKTLFRHASHLTTGQRCEQCHQLTGTDEQSPVALPDHLSIKKDQCLVCHNTDAVPTSCNGCHQYHWQGFSTPDPVGHPLPIQFD